MEKYIMVATNEQIERSKARRKVIEALEYNPMCYNCKSFGKSCKFYVQRFGYRPEYKLDLLDGSKSLARLATGYINYLLTEEGDY